MNQPARNPADPGPSRVVAPAAAAEPAPRVWKVNFVLPQPRSMPSERLKARAELVRSALGCCSY